MKKVLWVTSFAADMYEASGKQLLTSFYKSVSVGELFVATENLTSLTTKIANNRTHVWDLNTDLFLSDFLAKHSDIIPEALGGSLKEPSCKCEGGPYEPHSKTHKMPCVGHWFNKNFSRWFRKVAALKAAAERKDVDIMIWIDSDCRFKAKVTEPVVRGWFKNRFACFYLKNKRPVIETGIVGYWMKNQGHKLLSALIERYTSGLFLKDPRWDDSYQTQRALAISRVTSVDLATNVGDHAAVVPFSPLAQYIEHDKGLHGRKLGIMT